ncbi:MAG: TetR/AcrR family transcriptional regulator [bacterium]|nr:TetR/AcrR family transcriptional regulator [Gammaproteobacteria bacterium]HIL95761.1 TetR/AcrR family transcriptional regulator [Pseudomonadales bacterium]
MSAKQRTRLSPSARIDQLLDVAKQMIVSDGLQLFTIESLARTAAVSSPLVYNYFSSRQALLRTLLEREYRVIGSTLFSEVGNANSFEEVIRMFVANNFDHHAPGNILPVLLSQPEIADSIRELRKQQGIQTARYLVENTAKTYKLTVEQAQLAVTMSSGASIAAAEWVAMNKLDRKHAIDMALAYIKAGMEGLADD